MNPGNSVFSKRKFEKKKRDFQEKQTAVVLGAPRSGTSLVSGILYRLGVDMGRIREPDTQNPTGYYEDRDFLTLGSDILKATNEQAHVFNPPPKGEILKEKDQFKNRIKALINKKTENTSSCVWGFKVTTVCYSLPLFLPHIYNPRIVVVLRNQLDIAKSVVEYTKDKDYEKLTLVQAFRVTNYCYRCIFEVLKENPDLKVLFVSYEDITENSERQALRMGEFLDKNINTESIQKIKNYVNSPKEMRKTKKMAKGWWHNRSRTPMDLFVRKK